MIREQKAPPGSRSDFTQSTSQENYNPAPRPRAASGKEPTLSASTRNNHSLFSFGGPSTAVNEKSSSTFEFLPSPSFDDLQSSIASASDDFKNLFPAPGGQSILGEKRPIEAMAEGRVTGTGTGIGAGRGTTGPRPARSASLLRRQSTSTRQSSISSIGSGASGSMDPPSAPLAMRNRRQPQHPPISASAATNARAPRKSIGPGVIDTDYARPAQRRRPSLASNTSLGSVSDAGGVSTRVNIGGTTSYTEGARGLTASRAAKTKSLQPPSRQGQTHLTPVSKSSTPDHNRSSLYAGRSPGRSNGQGATTPSSAKRMSVMPPSNSHASGLGARTVSPTDARRAKRLSVLQPAPPMPNTPPQPEEFSFRASPRSPSMLPRKIPTPASSRTTPDLTRKSYSSGLSIGSNASYNTSQTSSGSLQPRLSIPPASSRLPTLKTRNLHSSTGNNEEEEVPPVPAIPKAYESPKDSPVEPPFFKRKSSLPFDASSINSISTNSLSGRTSAKEPVKNERPPKARKQAMPTNSDADQNNTTPVNAKKKNLQPLRLPPLNLLPLSTPTTTKIAALHEPTYSDGQVTPPPRRTNAKTPSTPMTASKASFFSRNRSDEKIEPNVRSSSSVHHLRSESPQMGSSSEASKPIPVNNRQPRTTVSPFISSSLPKNGEEHSYMPRSKTSGDFMNHDGAAEPARPARLTGPRAPKNRAPKTETPTEISSPEEPATPSSGSSLRRKLSLGWKRTTSKGSNSISQAANERSSEYPPAPPKHDNMPPPRLPASATLGNLSSYTIPSPSPSVKSNPTYLDSKRRKSSASSLSTFGGHDRTRSDSWGLNGSPKKEDPQKTEKPASAAPRTASSAIHKMLSSKPSNSTMKVQTQDPWTVDLDKQDLVAESEMKRLASKRKETEQAARVLDNLKKRATPKERVGPQQALQIANLNIYERGEIMDYKDVFFCGTQSAAKHSGDLSSEAANFGYDDDRGDYTIAQGDHLSYRYEIIDLLGKGSFGQVVRCIDHKTGGLVAIKIIRNKKRFHQQALVEVNILQKLREWDPNNKYSMVNFVQSFYFRSHLCISTELLDMNLYEFIKSNSFKGFPLEVVRRFTKQMLNSLLLLKSKKVIHCDLKPENILLTHPMHSEIKVIDFGSSCFENERVYTYIQSRFYRSPEVILGMTYGMPIDMWSLGCILAELLTGVPIFPGENEQEQLACIMEVFGPPEKHLIEKSTRRKLFFDSLGKPRLTVSSKGRRRRPSSKTLTQVLKCDDETFLDFLTRCLKWDPEKRMRPDEAVRHEFITGKKITTAPVSRSTTRNESPIKRAHTTTTPANTNRPLPEPPTTSFKNGNPIRTAASPIKNAMNTSRRASNIGSVNSVGIGSKRTSTGGPVAGGSGLPRVMTRSVSKDLASAGATAAMSSSRR
ncbi:Dual specificity protein kinase pom1 [Lachnellula cervina]|uniref:Dual specificity protein kinase pom1 n=1 Tax=Lachnellula cervina TaxID=1316786 RepID=A0A7D8YPQ1_9HELO|nr:Dual specificity protein kinase pom1 [Lachnellula cervina]